MDAATARDETTILSAALAVIRARQYDLDLAANALAELLPEYAQYLSAYEQYECWLRGLDAAGLSKHHPAFNPYKRHLNLAIESELFAAFNDQEVRV